MTEIDQKPTHSNFTPDIAAEQTSLPANQLDSAEQLKEIEVAEFLMSLARQNGASMILKDSNVNKDEATKPQLDENFRQQTLDECRRATSDLCDNAYLEVCRAFRATGPLSDYNRTLLNHLQFAMQIKSTKAAASRRLVLNDDRLEAIARIQNPNIDINASWFDVSQSDAEKNRFFVDLPSPSMRLAAKSALNNVEFKTMSQAFENIQNLPCVPYINDAMREKAKVILKTASEKASELVRKNLTYVEMAQVEADKVAAKICTPVDAPIIRPKAAFTNLNRMSRHSPNSFDDLLQQASKASTALPTILTTSVVTARKPRGRPPGSGKHQVHDGTSSPPRRKRQAVTNFNSMDIIKPIVLDEVSSQADSSSPMQLENNVPCSNDPPHTSKRTRAPKFDKEESCARTRLFNRETIDLHKSTPTSGRKRNPSYSNLKTTSGPSPGPSSTDAKLYTQVVKKGSCAVMLPQKPRLTHLYPDLSPKAGSDSPIQQIVDSITHEFYGQQALAHSAPPVSTTTTVRVQVPPAQISKTFVAGNGSQMLAQPVYVVPTTLRQNTTSILTHPTTHEIIVNGHDRNDTSKATIEAQLPRVIVQRQPVIADIYYPSPSSFDNKLELAERMIHNGNAWMKEPTPEYSLDQPLYQIQNPGTSSNKPITSTSDLNATSLAASTL